MRNGRSINQTIPIPTSIGKTYNSILELCSPKQGIGPDIASKYHSMNVKRLFGTALTLLGVVGLIYAAILFINTGGQTRDVKGIIISGLLGLVFFVSGIGLQKGTKDES